MLDKESLLSYLKFMAEDMESYDNPLNQAKAETYRAVIRNIEEGRFDIDMEKTLSE